MCGPFGKIGSIQTDRTGILAGTLKCCLCFEKTMTKECLGSVDCGIPRKGI